LSEDKMILKINNIEVKYHEVILVIKGVSIEVPEGGIVALLGANGAGKSTTIRCMMDFIRPQEGSVGILGMDARRDSVELKKAIGYLAGNVQLYGKWTGREHINFFDSLSGGADFAEELVERLDFDPSVRVKHLSSGNRQKLGIILAFMSRPRVLILDEPTLGLDPLLQNTVYNLLAESTENGATVFMSSHNLAEVDRVCSRVGIIRLGEMVATENITALKKKKISTMYVAFTDPVGKEDFLDENTELVLEAENTLTLKIKGDVNALIKRLGTYTVSDIRISQASLEDIFMEYYEKD